MRKPSCANTSIATLLTNVPKLWGSYTCPGCHPCVTTTVGRSLFIGAWVMAPSEVTWNVVSFDGCGGVGVAEKGGTKVPLAPKVRLSIPNPAGSGPVI